jgi:hypothetical protein
MGPISQSINQAARERRSLARGLETRQTTQRAIWRWRQLADTCQAGSQWAPVGHLQRTGYTWLLASCWAGLKESIP